MKAMDKPHKFIASFAVVVLNLVLLSLASNFVYYFWIVDFGVSVDSIFDVLFLALLGAAYGGFIIFSSGALLVLIALRLLVVPVAVAILHANKLFAKLIGVAFIPITLFLIVYPVTFLSLPIFILTFPILSLLPIVWISLVGYKSFPELWRKLIIPSLLMFFVVGPVIAVTAHWDEIGLKRDLGSLHRPTYLPDGMGSSIGDEDVIPPRIIWHYYCSSSRGGNSTVGSFSITQSELGANDFRGKPITLEAELDRLQLTSFEPVSVHDNSGYYYFNEIVGGGISAGLVWTTETNLVSIGGNCGYLNKSEVLKIAESMFE